MIIKKKRIRNLNKYLGFIKSNDIVVGVAKPTTETLKKIGFTAKSHNGDTILPPALGPISRFNAEGKEDVHRDQPMETAYRQVEWTWEQWAGYHETETQSKIVDVPYKRYPRSLIAPPAIELTITTNSNGNKVIMCPAVKNWQSQPDTLIHVINLFLELFGECSFFDSDMNQFIKAPLRRLNWKILPHGKRPYEKLKDELEPVLKTMGEGKRVVAENRIETINSHNPEFAAVGEGGFSGYIVLGFPKKKLFILESLLYGNATYIFGKQWEPLSKMTKAEILNHNLQTGRIIHREGWQGHVNKWLSSK